MEPAITDILESRLGAKKKVKALAEALLNGSLDCPAFARALPALADTDRATVVESLESASRQRPELVDRKVFAVLIECLSDDAARVRWEAARTVANVAAQHRDSLGSAVDALLANTTHDGTVVRWATAQALAAILRAGYTEGDLDTRIRDLAAREQDNGVRAVYDKALRGRR